MLPRPFNQYAGIPRPFAVTPYCDQNKNSMMDWRMEPRWLVAVIKEGFSQELPFEQKS